MSSMKKMGNYGCKVWIAIFAVLMQALLPGLLSAPHSASGAYGEVCTAFGLKTVRLSNVQQADVPSQPPLGGSHAPAHCALCLAVHIDALPTPSTPFDFTIALPVIALFILHAAPVALVYQAANPRGPPSLS